MEKSYTWCRICSLILRGGCISFCRNTIRLWCAQSTPVHPRSHIKTPSWGSSPSRLPTIISWYPHGTPTKRQVSKRPVSKCLKRQVYKTPGLQKVRFTKCQVYKTSGLQNVRLKKNIHRYFVLVVCGNPQVLLQPCLQAKWWLCFILYFRGYFAIYHHNK